MLLLAKLARFSWPLLRKVMAVLAQQVLLCEGSLGGGGLVIFCPVVRLVPFSLRVLSIRH